MRAALVLACSAAMGALGAPDGSSGGYVTTLAVLGAAAGALVALSLRWLLAAVNPASQGPGGPTATATWHGLLVLVPFAAMAAIAELGLGWSAAGVLAAASLLTACSVAGGEAAAGRGGGHPSLLAALAPTALGMAASTLWVIGISAAPHLLSGAGG